MSEYEKAQQLFHMIAGCYISGKIFAEYSCLLKHEIDVTKKGQRTILNRVIEAEARTVKAVNVLGEQLRSIGCDISITETEIEKLEEVLYEIVKLDSSKQFRVLNLIKKLQRESELIET